MAKGQDAKERVRLVAIVSGRDEGEGKSAESRLRKDQNIWFDPMEKYLLLSLRLTCLSICSLNDKEFDNAQLVHDLLN